MYQESEKRFVSTLEKKQTIFSAEKLCGSIAISQQKEHGIHFGTLTKLRKDEGRIEIRTVFPKEPRYIVIGNIEEKLWTPIFSRRNDIIRIVSVRRARKREPFQDIDQIRPNIGVDRAAIKAGCMKGFSRKKPLYPKA